MNSERGAFLVRKAPLSYSPPKELDIYNIVPYPCSLRIGEGACSYAWPQFGIKQIA